MLARYGSLGFLIALLAIACLRFWVLLTLKVSSVYDFR
jgi:hypothetical protein